MKVMKKLYLVLLKREKVYNRIGVLFISVTLGEIIIINETKVVET